MQPWMQNCGVRRLPLDFRDQYFGCEIELTGINRATAAHALADLFGTRAEHSGGGYDITHSNSGEGLLFYGNVTIPFVDRFPRGEIYDLLTTRPEDMKNETKNE